MDKLNKVDLVVFECLSETLEQWVSEGGPPLVRWWREFVDQREYRWDDVKIVYIAYPAAKMPKEWPEMCAMVMREREHIGFYHSKNCNLSREYSVEIHKMMERQRERGVTGPDEVMISVEDRIRCKRQGNEDWRWQVIWV